jgi:hypothetical protein
MLFEPVVHRETVQVVVGQLAAVRGLPGANVDLRDRASVLRDGLPDP